MRARLALVLAASMGLAACQGDDLASPSATTSAATAQENLLNLVPENGLSEGQRGRLAVLRGARGTEKVTLARIAESPARLLKKGSVVRLGIAPGVDVIAAGERFEQRSAGDISWAGPVSTGDGWVQAVFMDGGMTATVTLGRSTYSVEPIGNGLHAVSLIDQTKLPPEHTADNPSGVLDASAGPLLARGGNGGNGGTDGTETGGIAALSTINVLVVYTASAATRAGNIASKIQLAVDETNQSYVNSGININMVRVHTAQVTYNETGTFSQHISRLQGTTDGYMDNVHTLRNTYGADVVVLVVNDTEACGIAAAIKATASSAFAVADQSCITGYYSFAHEIGHLQGARHDRFVDGTLSPYQYGHGFIPSSKNWRTIMAYGNNCSNCTRIQWWSNPLKTYPSTGQVMGTATYEDNARVLNLTAPTVALFR